MEQILKISKNKFFFIISKVKLIRKSLFFLILLFLSLMIYYMKKSLFKNFSFNNLFFQELRNNKDNYLRNLDSKINKTETNINKSNLINKDFEDLEIDQNIKVMPLNINVTEKILFYEFLKTISTGYYIGQWENLKIKNNHFKEIKGEGDIDFNIKTDKNYLLNLGESSDISKMKVDINIKDGRYIDDFLEIKFKLIFNNETLIDIKNESLSIIMSNASISLRWKKFIFSEGINYLNETFINITFLKDFKLYENYIDYRIYHNKYGKIFVEIKNSSFNEDSNSYENNFEITFKGTGYRSTIETYDLLNYSIYLTILCFIELYYFSKFKKSMNMHDNISLNLNIITIWKNLMWVSFIGIINLYIYFVVRYLYVEQEFYMIGFLYFEYSIALITSLFIMLELRNVPLFFSIILFVCDMFIFIFLIRIVFFVNSWYSNIIIIYFFVMTWTEQIISCARKLIRPPFPYSLILSMAFSKINIICYVKIYKNSIFELKPNARNALLCCIYIAFETIILCLQKHFGSQFFVPKRFRKKCYNYYRKENEISEAQKEIECSICLDKIGNIAIENNERMIKGNCYQRYINKINEKIKNINKANENYMVTPCNHFFHSVCLEPWLNISNKCPSCRTNIPPLNYDL